MRLIAAAALLSSLTFVACQTEKVEAAKPAAPTVVVVNRPAAPAKPAPVAAPAPAPKKDSFQIGPGGVAVESNDSDSSTRVKIDFPTKK